MEPFDQTVPKTFVNHVNKYLKDPSEPNCLNLQRQIDILSTFLTYSSSLKQINLHQLLKECLASILNLFLEPLPKQILIEKSVTFLSLLAQHNVSIRRALCPIHHIHYAISTLLHNCSLTDQDPLFHQSLQLLELVTFGIEISHLDDYLKDFILLLVELTQKKSKELNKIGLSILCNFCRHNTVVQFFIQHIDDSHKFYKHLTKNLGESRQDMVVLSLSVLAFLVIDLPIGEKIFIDQNMKKTLELVLNIIVAGDIGSKKLAVDLLMDLKSIPKLNSYFLNFRFLHQSLTKIVDLCFVKDDHSQSIISVINLILAFLKYPEVKAEICSLLSASCFEKLVQILLRPKEKDMELILLAEKLFLQIIEAPEMQTNILNHKALLISLQESLHQTFHETMTSSQDKMFIACNSLETLNLLRAINKCCHKHDIPLKYLDREFLGTIIAQFIKHFSNSSEEICFLQVILKLILVEKDTDTVQYLLSGCLKDTQFYNVLSSSITSPVEAILKDGLTVMILVNTLEEFCPTKLRKELLKKNMETKEYNFNNYTLRPTSSQDMDQNIQNLIDRLDTGLNIADFKQSEIMELYEHKLASLSVREQRVQELVEAKSLALQQSDRLLGQYRAQEAAHEMETIRLRQMLKEFENKTEKAKEALSKSQENHTKVNSVLYQAQKSISFLEQQSEEQKETINDLQQKIVAHLKNVEALRLENQNQVEMNTVLQKHNDNLRLKQEKMSEQIANLESLKDENTKLIREKENKIKELQRSFANSEESLKLKIKEHLELEKSYKKQSDYLKKTEAVKDKLTKDLKALELVCSQHESTIQDLKTQIKETNKEFEKFKDLKEKIHILTSL